MTYVGNRAYCTLGFPPTNMRESFNNHRDGVIQKGIGSRVKKAQTDESQNVIAFGRVLT